MIVLRTALRLIAGVFASLLALAVLLLVATAIVNRDDEPPSESTRRFTELYRSWPVVADDQNGYVYLMGIEAAVGEDPYAMGLRRIAWLREVTAGRPLDDREDPLGPAGDRWRARPADVEAFLESCQEPTPECVAAFASADALFEQWTAASDQLLPRYLELLTRDVWHDDFPQDLSLPLAPLAAAIDGQRLLLLSAYLAAERGDVELIRERLAADLGFWRRVLESTDMLITKMVATRALNRNFEWGNLILRQLPMGMSAAALPPSWGMPLTDAERSVFRCMTGEWLFVAGVLRVFERESVLSSGSWLDRVRAPLLEWAYQPQDTINRFADHYWALSETFEVPLEDYPAALARASDLTRATADSAFSRPLYNLGGGVHLAEISDFNDYAARAADIEGVRRAALAAVTLRDAGVAVTDVAASLGTSELRNPYDGSPLGWDATDEVIVFRGLEPYARGEHRLYY
jgi:hypothetical protein